MIYLNKRRGDSNENSSNDMWIFIFTSYNQYLFIPFEVSIGYYYSICF
nr:MAG TPA: hypothetical protein [Caudoviricetes sp.]